MRDQHCRNSGILFPAYPDSFLKSFISYFEPILFTNLAESIVLFSSPIFPFLSLPSPAHPAGFFFCFYTGFLAIFIVCHRTTIIISILNNKDHIVHIYPPVWLRPSLLTGLITRPYLIVINFD